MLKTKFLWNLAGAVAIIFASVGIPTQPAHANDEIGIILMHGKGGTSKPRSPIGKLASALESNGFKVLAPDMPWSRSRIWDKSYEDAMKEIDSYVKELRDSGAKKIIVGGHSIGANAAIGYGARRDGLAGILAIAPGHIPEIGGFQNRMEHDYKRAKKMVDEDKGRERTDFKDFNQGKLSEVNATAQDYLSWYSPDGPAVMPKNAAALKPNTPLMWVIGEKDVMLRNGRDESYAFSRAPSNPKNQYVVVKGGHKVTPQKGEDEIISWLKGL